MMAEKLPKKFPEQLLIEGKTYRYLSPDNAVQCGMSSGGEGYKKWHYYVSDKAWQAKGEAPVGMRRHFTIYIGSGGKNASIHVSLKNSSKKPINNMKGEAHFWFKYETQNYEAAPNWKFIDKTRQMKIEKLFSEFVKALTEVDTPSKKTESPPHQYEAPYPIKPGDAWDTDEFLPEGVKDEPRPLILVPTFIGGDPDDWENYEY
jgi:hypothetical protein